MFTRIFVLVFSIIFLILLYILLKKNELKFNKILKIISIIYLVFILTIVVLPDGLIMSVDDEVNKLVGINKLFLIVRIFKAIIPICVFVGVLYNNKYFKNILFIIGIVTVLLSLVYYDEYIYYYIQETGRGLNKIPVLPDAFKMFLLNKNFRSILFGIEMVLILVISVSSKIINFTKIKNLKEVFITLGIFLFLLFQFMPIYIPQLLFEGYSSFIFDNFNVCHIIWILYIIIKILIVYFIFKNKSYNDKYLCCLVLAFAAFIQYNTLFSLTISIERLPFQLCNMATYVMMIALLTKNKHLFNFNFLVNVVGAFLAIIMPDINGRGLFEVWNMHFIYEHTNVLVTPIMCLLLKVFENIDEKSYKDAFIGFLAYFIFCVFVGTTFNVIATVNNKDIFEVNYLFMFDMEKALDVLPFLEPFTKITLNIKGMTIYPVIMLIVYFGYMTFVSIFYLPFYIYNKRKQK